MTSIQKQAKELIAEVPRASAAEWESMAEWINSASELLRQIASVGEDSEPIGYLLPYDDDEDRENLEFYNSQYAMETKCGIPVFTQKHLDAAYLKGLETGQQQAQAWLQVIDEAMMVHHMGVANAEDTYEIAKDKLNRLLSFAQDIGAYYALELAKSSEKG